MRRSAEIQFKMCEYYNERIGCYNKKVYLNNYLKVSQNDAKTGLKQTQNDSYITIKQTERREQCGGPPGGSVM